jgi:dTDP-4-amino-4,6-dideoxygalactose transaminase
VKHHRDDLAVFGGRPAFAEPLHVGRPNVAEPQRFLARAASILERRWLTNDGEYVHEFEHAVAREHGVRHCVAACNGTLALGLCARALDLRGEVILPSFTFVATAHALDWNGLVPVFCDVDPATHAIDPARVEALVTPRTSAILGVHLWGRPCPVAPLAAIAARHRLRLLFDAAHAFACRDGHRMIGGAGDAEVLSFHATKIVNTFEGGAILTSDDDLAARLRLYRNCGFQGLDRVVSPGINARMTEISAAMGLTGLECLPAFLEANRANFEAYREGLSGIPGISFVETGTSRAHVVAEVDAREAGVTRDRLVEVLWAENVRARRYFHPGCHRHEPYRSREPGAGARLQATERLCERVLVLPTGTAVTPGDARTVCEVIRLAVEG